MAFLFSCELMYFFTFQFVAHVLAERTVFLLDAPEDDKYVKSTPVPGSARPINTVMAY